MTKDLRFVGIEQTLEISSDSSNMNYINGLIAIGWKVLHILKNPVYQNLEKSWRKKTLELTGYSFRFIIGRPINVPAIKEDEEDSVYDYLDRLSLIPITEVKSVEANQQCENEKK